MSLRHTVEAYCRRKTGRAPDLETPRGYNDKLAWLKLYDQMPEQVTCCDKLAAREHVAGVIGRSHLLEVHQVARSTGELRQVVPSMVKASHDSGSARRATDDATWRRACECVGRALGRVHGVSSGEWAYARVPPRCFTEEALPAPVTDYKFHCGAGGIFWVQVIRGLESGRAVEAITDREGMRLPLHFNRDNRKADEAPAIPPTWPRMVEIAQELSLPFRYVRVDLYSVGDRVWFGELTFWPLAGICLTPDEPAFGAMLDIDLSYTRLALA